MTDVQVETLTPSQRTAYNATENRLLILGGPGTGKTALALLLARKAVDAEPTSARRVLFLTFSRAATTELARRAPRALSGSAGSRIDITTFHSFSMTMLNAFRRFVGGPQEPVSILTQEESKLGLSKEGSLTFDELVPSAIRLLDQAPWLSEAYMGRYCAVICDEFQDTSRPAAELLERLGTAARLICLADQDQVIFDWTDPTIANRLGELRRSGVAEYDLGYDSRRDPSNVIPRAASAIRRREFRDEALLEACRDERLRVLHLTAEDNPFQVLAIEIVESLKSGMDDVGVFLATNKNVTEFAELLREEGVEHEIVGLSGAAGEAQVAAAACAAFITGTANWEDFLLALGVFTASCYRGEPPQLAVNLVHHPDQLGGGLLRQLTDERASLEALAGEPLQAFLTRMETFWGRLFVGRPRRLWELGIKDLIGQTLLARQQTLNEGLAAQLGLIADQRRGAGYVDYLPAPLARVRLMNVYQVKGREMDEVFLVHLPGDRDAWNPTDMQRLARVHYVSLSRARRRATIVLPEVPAAFFRPYSTLCP